MLKVPATESVFALSISIRIHYAVCGYSIIILIRTSDSDARAWHLIRQPTEYTSRVVKQDMEEITCVA